MEFLIDKANDICHLTHVSQNSIVECRLLTIEEGKKVFAKVQNDLKGVQL